MNKPVVRLMIYKEARECVDEINSSMNNVRHLVLDLYDREGWTALGYQSWRECVTGEFKQSENYLYRQLEVAQVEKNILPMGKTSDQIPERQLRPLVSLRDNPAVQREAWQMAVSTAPDGKITAAHVSKIVKEMTKKNDDISPVEPEQCEITEAKYIAAFIISHLERIRKEDPRREEQLIRIMNWIKKQLKGE